MRRSPVTLRHDRGDRTRTATERARDDEAVVYDFSTELQRERAVTLLAMVMNAARTALPTPG
jgi:hypothetical protein